MNCPIRISYTIRRGDTFYKIAQRYRTTAEILQMENPHMNPGQLMVGDVITICPGVTSAGTNAPAPEPVAAQKQERKKVHVPLPPTPAPVSVAMPAPVPTPVPAPMYASVAVPAQPVYEPVRMPEIKTVQPPVYDTDTRSAPVQETTRENVPAAVQRAVNPEPAANADLHDLMRSLWEQMALWEHELIVSITENLTDVAAVNNRVMQGNNDIAALFAPFYDPGTSYKLAEFLNRNLALTVQYTQLSKSGNADGAAAEMTALKKNTEQLVMYLCKLNPHFDCEGLRRQFNAYLDSVKEAANSRVNKSYYDDIAAADEMAFTALQIADNITNGLMKLGK